MLEEEDDKKKTLEEVDKSLKYNRNAILVGGDGRFSVTFEGTLNGDPVAVHKTFLNTVQVITKNKDLSKLKHLNIAQLLYVTSDADFRYDALELYAASLDCLFLRNDDPKKYRGTMPSNEQVLLQLANGLHYLHTQDILHGDIKPENILISSTGESVQMKWTRFGFRQSNLNDSFSLTLSATKMGLRKWWPPEMYKDKKKISKKGEIFSAGCVFLYFLSGGIHPFAQDVLRESDELDKNVSRKIPVKFIGPNNSDLSTTHFAFVRKMIYKNPENRIALWDVIRRLEKFILPIFSKQIDLLPSLSYVEKTSSNGQYSSGLFLSESETLAVKRIPIQYCSVKPFITELIKLNHSNIVRLLDCHEHSSYKYFTLEYCSASLEQRFLPEGDPKKYTGPMPSHEQVFIQLVSGLKYIHEKDLVHCSIKPSNVLITANENPKLKLADLGYALIAPRWDNMNSISSDALVFSGFKNDHYWLAPELLKILKGVEPNGTEKSNRKENFMFCDIFSVGKMFLYYCNLSYAELILNGIALNNVSEGNQEYVFKKLPIMGNFVKENNNESNNMSPVQLIYEMTKEDPKSRLKLKNVIECVNSLKLTSKGELEKPKESSSGNIQFSREYILGSGSYGNVHLGLWKDSIAAVKRIYQKQQTRIVIEREEELQQLNHPNIVEFYGSEKDNDFTYIAMEKCLTSLDSFCRQPQLFHGVILMPTDKKVLLQIAEGLQYIHSRNLIHRDVKPENILISGDKPAVIKWTDFGLSKRVANKDGTIWSSKKGTKGWMAPEVDKKEMAPEVDKKEMAPDVLPEKVIAGEKSDIFCLGCVFFFFLTPTIHPFGNNSNERKNNIRSKIQPNLTIPNPANPSMALAFTRIIKGMIEFDPPSRTELSKVIEDLNAI